MTKGESKLPERATSGIFRHRSRRDFLKATAAGGAVVALPSLLTSCKLGDTTSSLPPGFGESFTFDFSRGDVAVLQFLYCYKQLQADLYDRISATISTSSLTDAERALVAQIHDHEIAHYDTLRSILGTLNDFTVTPLWGQTDFEAVSILTLAQQFEDTSVGLYNDVPQLLTSAANVMLCLEISSVEARHAAAIRDDLTPRSGGTQGFAPHAVDASFPIQSVAGAIQPFIAQALLFSNVPPGQ